MCLRKQSVLLQQVWIFNLYVVWIVAEDINTYLEYYGDSTIHTPDFHRTASEGLSYCNVYSFAGVWVPSRSADAPGEEVSSHL